MASGSRERRLIDGAGGTTPLCPEDPLPSPKAWALKPSGESAGQGLRTLWQEEEDEDCQDQNLLIDYCVSGF